MARFGEITIEGLYEADDTIFDDWTLPKREVEGEQVTPDKDILIANVLSELNEFEILVPDTDRIKEEIKWWSKKMFDSWSTMFKVLNEDYNPLHNFDRNETNNETESANNSVSSNDSSSGSNTTAVSAYNSSDLADRDEVTTSLTGSASSTSTNSITRGYIKRMYGNIGVTTSQQMLEAELKLRAEYNIYDIMIMDFRDRFCLPIY